MKMTGIILSDVYDAMLGDLTAKRTFASLPFAGRYRLIDFVLSNMVNSGIYSIGIITKYNYRSLMEHLGSGAEWDLSRKNANFCILPPFVTGSTSVYRGSLEALSNAVEFLKSGSNDYVLICDTTIVCNIDYGEVLKNHLHSGADVTLIAGKNPSSYDASDYDLFLKKDENGKVTDLALGEKPEGESLVGMGMYLMERDYLIGIIKSYVARGRYRFDKDFLVPSFSKKEVKINAYEFEGPMFRNHNVLLYFKNNFSMMKEPVREAIFNSGRPIYTRVRDEVPTYYADSSDVKDALIANGCVIRGKVDNAVIFRNVKIGESASVKNAIIMDGTVIGKGAKIENAIIDKNVTVTSGATLIGASNLPVFVQKDNTI